MKYAEALTNLHKSGINKNSTPQEIAAASVGTTVNKNGTPNISSVSQGQSYGSALKNLKSNPQPNVNQNSNGTKPNNTGSQNNTGNNANANITGSTKPSSSANTSRSANSTNSTSSSNKFTNEEYNQLAAQVTGVAIDPKGRPVFSSYEESMKYAAALTNLHQGGINRNSTPQEIAAASVGTKLDKNGNPIISNALQGQNYGNALKNIKSGTVIYTAEVEPWKSGSKPQSETTSTISSKYSQRDIEKLEEEKGTIYVWEHIYNKDASKYDPYKRASQLLGGIPLRGNEPYACGPEGVKAFKAKLYGTGNNVSNSNKANTTQLYLKESPNNLEQDNGNQYSYNFTESFNDELQETVNNVVDSVESDNLSSSDKETLKEILPYIIKGIGASESSWSDNSEGFVGLIPGGLNPMNTWGFVTFGNGYKCETNPSSYKTPMEGAKIAAEMLVHMTSCDMANNGTDFDVALYNSWVQYCGGEKGAGSQNHAAYQMGMANDFYIQDHGNSTLFSDVESIQNTVNNLNKYNVYVDENAHISVDVTINPDKIETKER